MPKPAILGVRARPVRPTFGFALWLATLLSVPVFGILAGIDLAWRWLS
ncbi:MAG: hypothetical protein AAF281_07095 [Pseudomonadota bacterium]